MGRRRVDEDWGVDLLRDVLRESLAWEGMLESWGVLVEDEEQREKDGTVSDPTPIDPNLTPATELYLQNPTAYKAKVKRSIEKHDGHLGPAAKDLKMSKRTLQRHLNKNFSPGEVDKLRAPPGPDTGETRGEKERKVKGDEEED